MGNERYGPETVRAQSLGELRWAVEEKIENDVGQVVRLQTNGADVLPS